MCRLQHLAEVRQARSSMPTASGPTTWPPAITPGWCRPPTATRPSAAAWTRARTSPTCSAASPRELLAADDASRWASTGRSEIRQIAASSAWRGRQARQPGNLLRRPTRTMPASSANAAAAADTSGEIVTTDGEVVGRHEGWSTSRSASVRGWASRSANPATWSGWSPRRGAWWWARSEELARRDLTASGANWLASPPPPVAAR